MDAPPANAAPLADLRLVVVTGKGGVGKTTVAAALAHALAASGRRVLVAETGSDDTAPSPLRRALGNGSGALPDDATVRLSTGLEAMRLSPSAGHRRFVRDTLPLGFVAERALRSGPLRRFLEGAPAFGELGLLYQGLSLVEHGLDGARFDTLVLDAPASGHTLAIARLPEVAAGVFAQGPVAAAIARGRALLTDPQRTGVVLTTLPEPLPAAEAHELADGLLQQQIAIRLVVANRRPEDPLDEPEHAALREASAGRDTPHGRLQARLEQARDAVAQLSARFGDRLVTLPEQEGGDERRVPSLSDRLRAHTAPREAAR